MTDKDGSKAEGWSGPYIYGWRVDADCAVIYKPSLSAALGCLEEHGDGEVVVYLGRKTQPVARESASCA